MTSEPEQGNSDVPIWRDNSQCGEAAQQLLWTSWTVKLLLSLLGLDK